jgi:hypothetical protein
MAKPNPPSRPRRTQAGPFRVPDASKFPARSLLAGRRTDRIAPEDVTKRYKTHLRGVATSRPAEPGVRRPPDPSVEVLRGPEPPRGLRPPLPVREPRGLFRPERDGSRPAPGEALGEADDGDADEDDE